MNDIELLNITNTDKNGVPHSFVGHTQFYKTRYLMVEMDAKIQDIVSERNASYIMEPISLRGNNNYFSFKWFCKNPKQSECQYINNLMEGDIVLFQDATFGMEGIDKSYYLHIGINGYSRKSMKMFIIKRNDEMIVMDKGNWRNITNSEYKMITNKLNQIKNENIKLRKEYMDKMRNNEEMENNGNRDNGESSEENDDDNDYEQMINNQNGDNQQYSEDDDDEHDEEIKCGETIKETMDIDDKNELFKPSYDTASEFKIMFFCGDCGEIYYSSTDCKMDRCSTDFRTIYFFPANDDTEYEESEYLLYCTECKEIFECIDDLLNKCYCNDGIVIIPIYDDDDDDDDDLENIDQRIFNAENDNKRYKRKLDQYLNDNNDNNEEYVLFNNSNRCKRRRKNIEKSSSAPL